MNEQEQQGQGAGTDKQGTEEDQGLRETGGLRGSGSPPDQGEKGGEEPGQSGEG